MGLMPSSVVVAQTTLPGTAPLTAEGDLAEQMYLHLERECRDRPSRRLHYVTARELYNIIKAAEAGMTGDPSLYRDYVIPPYQTHCK